MAAIRWKEDRPGFSRAVVYTDQSVHVLDEKGATLFTAPLAYDQEAYGHIRVGQLENPNGSWSGTSPRGAFRAEPANPCPVT